MSNTHTPYTHLTPEFIRQYGIPKHHRDLINELGLMGMSIETILKEVKGDKFSLIANIRQLAIMDNTHKELVVEDGLLVRFVSLEGTVVLYNWNDDGTLNSVEDGDGLVITMLEYLPDGRTARERGLAMSYEDTYLYETTGDGALIAIDRRVPYQHRDQSIIVPSVTTDKPPVLKAVN